MGENIKYCVFTARQQSYWKVMFSLVFVCLFIMGRGKVPMWPLPMMHWTHPPPRHGTSVCRDPHPAALTSGGNWSMHCICKRVAHILLECFVLWQGYVFTGVCDSVHRGGGHVWQGRVWWLTRIAGVCMVGAACVQQRRPLQRTVTHLTGMLSCLCFL